MLTNKWIAGTADITEALSLREEVFTREQGASVEDHDELDQQALHLILYDDSVPVATGRIYHDGRTFCIGRCCVKKEERGEGIGDLLLKLLLLKTFEYNPSRIRIHAQQAAADFYKRYGFAPDGEPFLEAGIPHIEMYVDKGMLRIPSSCGKVQHFEDFFEPAPGTGGEEPA